MHGLCLLSPQSYVLPALKDSVPLPKLYGIPPDIGILLLYTFYQPVFYPIHNQSFPSMSEERAAFWIGFGEMVSDALMHKLLDADTRKILYRSAVGPTDGLHPNKHLAPDGGESSKTANTIIHVKSRQDEDQSATKPMPSYDPDSLIGRTFLLPKDNNGECLRAPSPGRSLRPHRN